MFGHNPFSWVPLRAESIISFKSEGGGQEWRSIPNSPDDAPEGWDDGTHEDNGWVADPCEASFFLWKGTGDQIGIAYPISRNYNTGTWWIAPAVVAVGNGSPSGGSVQGGATDMVVNGYQAGEPYIDAYTRVMMIVGNHWDGDTDQGFEANYPGEVSVEAIPTITTISRPAFGNAKWTWISGVSDIPTDCGTMNTTEDCGYSNWSEWSDCDKNREAAHPGDYDGIQTRTRTITSGSNCDGELTQTQDCISPKPCEWGEWSAWVYENAGSENKMHGQGTFSGCGVWNTATQSFPSSVERTRVRQLVSGAYGQSDEEGCPDRDTYIGSNGLTQYRNTHTETETVSCPTGENSNCPDGQEVKWRWGPTDATNLDGTRKKGWFCNECSVSPNDTYAEIDEHGCKTGCLSGYKDLMHPSWGRKCEKPGCTDPTAKNFDNTATIACNTPIGMTIDWNSNVAYRDVNADANRCCEYDCDNPLLKTDWNGQCKDECIDGYAFNSKGECEEQCNEGFELIDGECKKSPKKPKTTITTQSSVSTQVQPEETNMLPIIGGIGVLGLMAFFISQRE